MNNYWSLNNKFLKLPDSSRVVAQAIQFEEMKSNTSLLYGKDLCLTLKWTYIIKVIYLL